MPNLSQTEKNMQTVIEVLKAELKNIHTGRASASLVEDIKVMSYGQPTSIKAIASISVPEATQVAIRPWSPDQIGAIELAIRESDLGVNPNNDGVTVRVNFPPLTEERRRDLVKKVKQIAEEARIELRNLRRHTQDELKKELDSGQATEDDKFKVTKDLDEMIGKFNNEVEEVIKLKEAEILKV